MLSMKNKQFAFAVVGTAIGFILGFLVAQAVSLQDQFILQDTQGAGNPQQSSNLPEGHPSAQLMELMRTLQQRAEANPQDAEVRVALGNAFYDLKQFDQAAAWYQQALTLDSENVSVSTDLGTSYYYLGQHEKAIQQLQHSLHIDPTHPQTLQNLGVVLDAAGRSQEALATWEKLIETNPDYAGLDQVRQSIERLRERMDGGSS
ncbi:MAG TPA: tetratricopeptide repeat protein [Acidobacteriota bacterium]|nr:tetratricopeptide repeat protein [Acidobacteriota bacterium]